MRPAWAAQYVAVPFREKGRTRDGVDCYGLVRLIYQEQRGIELPSYADDYASTADAREITALVRGEVAARWTAIARVEARLFDVAIFTLCGQPTHVGLILDPPWFIHAMQMDASGAIGKIWMERWDVMRWDRRWLTAARWQEI